MPEIFHISSNGEVKGPYFKAQIKSMWDAGLLTADTLYWHEKKQEWHHLAEMLRGATLEEAFTPPPVEPTASEAKKENLAPADHRLMARFIDLQAFGFLGYFLSEWIVRKFSLDGATFYFPFGFTFAVMTESLWLAMFKHTTPGKWLFGLHIEGDGESFFTRRTWAVYWRSVPIIAPFATILAFQDINRTGTTKWDKKTGSRVCIRKVEWGRAGFGKLVFVLAIFAYVIALLALLNEVGRSPSLAPVAAETATPSASALPPSPTPVPMATKTDDQRTADNRARYTQFVRCLYPDINSYQTALGAAAAKEIETANARDPNELAVEEAAIIVVRRVARSVGAQPARLGVPNAAYGSALQILAIYKSNPTNADERIQAFYGLNPDNTAWAMRADDAVDFARSGVHSFFVCHNAPPVPVVVETREGHPYLKTQADSTTQNNLLSLPNLATQQ